VERRRRRGKERKKERKGGAGGDRDRERQTIVTDREPEDCNRRDHTVPIIALSASAYYSPTPTRCSSRLCDLLLLLLFIPTKKQTRLTTYPTVNAPEHEMIKIIHEIISIITLIKSTGLLLSSASNLEQKN
jgi:hypothetical protein